MKFLLILPFVLSLSPIVSTAAEPELKIEAIEAAANAPGATADSWVAQGNARMQEARDKVAHDFAPAEAAFKKALDLKQDSTGAMLGMAWVKNSEHLFEQGRGWAEKALAIDPDLVDAHALLGDYEVELGSYDEAYDHYQAAIDSRGDLSTYSRASQLLWITGDYRQATILMKKAIDAGGPYPENLAWCHVELGMMEFNSGGILPAEMEAKKALEAAPENPRALAMMGRMLAAKGQTDEAIAFYKKSIAITPTHQPLAALVDLYHLKGDGDAKKRAYEEVIQYHRPDPAKIASTIAQFGHFHPIEQASAELAMFLAEHGSDPDEAVKEAEKAYETYKNIRVEDALAWCYYRKGDYKKARLLIERALKWKTREPSLYYHRGMIHMKLGDTAKAADDLKEALALNPIFDPIHADLATKALAEISAPALPGNSAKEAE